MMKSTAALAVIIVFAVIGVTPANAGSDHCTQGDVQALANAGFQGASLNLGFGSAAGVGGSWANCQFRLFDDNEDPPDAPEIPHVFTDRDYVLGGIFEFEDYGFLDRPDYDRAAAIEYVKSITTNMYWGTVDTPDGNLVEIQLTESPFRDTVFAGFAHLVGHHRYHIFKPGDLEPGEYKWRLEHDDSVFGSFVARGSVIILET
jgi:hypothetical protein